MLNDPFKGRLPPSAWYPAGESGISAGVLDLGANEHVRVVAAGSSSGDPVVLIHGWGCSAYFFRRLLPAVAATGRRAIAIDLRGHGGSSKPTAAGAYTSEAMRAFAERTLDALNIGRAHIVAHSLGGGVAIDLAVAQPSRVRSLTLLAPVGLAPLRFVLLARLATPPLAASLVPYAVPRWSIPMILRAVNGADGRWASRDVDEYWAPTADPAFALALRALLHEYRFTPRTDAELAAIVSPALVILGDRDLLVRSRRSAKRVDGRHGWSTVMVERAGHVLAEEVPEGVLQALLPHLDRCR